MKRNMYISISIILLIIVSLYVYLNYIKITEYSKNLFHMDTYINIKLYTNKSVKEVNEIFDEIDYLFSMYHKLADPYNSYDNLINVYYLNEVLRDNESIEINPYLAIMIDDCITYYEETKGLFNIALGNVIQTWKDYLDNNEVPNIYTLKNSGSININDIFLNNTTYIKTNNVKIDLGAYAKGYVTELVGKFIEEEGISKYLINAGGNVKAGKSYKKDLYKIGIEDPNNKGNIYKIINIENKSIVTSGDYQRYTIINDIKYHHIIDPNTLMPSSNTRSVTVITEDSGYADIMSTYLFLLEPLIALEIVNKLDNVEAIWYIDDNNIIMSDGFKDYE